MTPLHKSNWWQESSGAGLATGAVKGLKPLLPQDFAKYLP
jgi:membrane protein required for colicin V production